MLGHGKNLVFKLLLLFLVVLYPLEDSLLLGSK